MRTLLALVAVSLLVPGGLARAQSETHPVDTRAFAAPPRALDEYQIGPHDLLEMKVFELQQLDRTVRVNADGTISLPLLGEVAVGGLTPREAEQVIAQLLQERKLVREPQVTVFVKEYISRRVYVQGAVTRPDTIELLGDRTLLDVIGEAGGLNERAGKRIFVVRPFGGPEEERIEVDADRLIYEADPMVNIQVQPGDIIVVPYEQEFQVFVNGAVARPGPVTFANWEQMTLLQAVTAAGGANDRANESRVQVIRRLPSGGKQIFKVNLKKVKKGKAEDPVLQRNDVVVVPESFF